MAEHGAAGAVGLEGGVQSAAGTAGFFFKEYREPDDGRGECCDASIPARERISNLVR